jgi:hypothetical protein
LINISGGNMKKIITISLTLIALMPLGGYTQQNYNFAVGFKGGTYESIAKSLDEITPLSFTILSTQGSTDIIRMVNEGKADFGIAQIDIFLDLDKRESQTTENVKFLLPLYSEELHILADRKIKSIDGLSGMTVSVGARNSGTSGTALIVIDQLDLMDKIKAMRFTDTKEGLEDLKNGKIDSLFIVSGVPVELLSGLESAFLEKFGLLSFNGEQYNKIIKNQYHYKKAAIGPRDYSWLKEKVNTLAVVSTIVVNKNVSEQVVSDIIKVIFANRKTLEKKHPKWKEMDDNTIRWYLEGRSYLFHKGAKKALESAGLKGDSLLAPD